MAIFDTFAKNVISLLIGLFSCGFLHSANLGQFSFQSILIRPSGDLYFLFFQPSEVRPKNRPFLKIFPWSPLCYLAKKGYFRLFCEKCYFSSNRSFLVRFFAQRKSTIVQLSIHTNQAIRRLLFPIFLALRSSIKKSAIFEKFPFAILRKMAIFDTFATNVISLLIGLFSCGFLHSANLGQFSFQSILIRPSGDLYFLFFQPSELRQKNRPFLKIFPWSPLCYFAKNGHFRHFCDKCYFSSNRSFFVRFFAQRKSRIVQLSIHTNQAIRRLVFPIFLAFRTSTKKSAIFENFPLVPPLLFCKKWPFSTLLREMLFIF